jgi:hypothetical protein
LGTVTFVTVIIPDRGTGEGVVVDVGGIGNVGGVEVGIDVVVDELGLLDEPEGNAVMDV